MTICCVHLEVVEATVTDSITDKQIKQQMKITSLRIRSSSRLLLRLSRTSSRWGVLIMFRYRRLECDGILLLNIIAYIKCDRVTQPLLWGSSWTWFRKCHLRKSTMKLLPDEIDLEFSWNWSWYVGDPWETRGSVHQKLQETDTESDYEMWEIRRSVCTK